MCVFSAKPNEVIRKIWTLKLAARFPIEIKIFSNYLTSVFVIIIFSTHVSFHSSGFRTQQQSTKNSRMKGEHCVSANIYLFKVSNRNTREKCEICSKLTIKSPKRRHWRRSGVFIVNFEHISHIFLAFLLFDFEQANVSWDVI